MIRDPLYSIECLTAPPYTKYLTPSSVNVPGRGYSFIAPVTRSETPVPSAPQAADEKRVHNLPAHLTRIIGRADIVNRLAARLPRQRLITIVGPGGIGKTTVALAVARR
jgi:ABC-type glutathione transport system ATPase component